MAERATVPGDAIGGALADLLSRLLAVGEGHRELYDTTVRYRLDDAVHHGFLIPTPGYQLPDHFALYSAEGNVAVREALATCLPAARAAAEARGWTLSTSGWQPSRTWPFASARSEIVTTISSGTPTRAGTTRPATRSSISAEPAAGGSGVCSAAEGPFHRHRVSRRRRTQWVSESRSAMASPSGRRSGGL
jgi:hypothetical protein